MDIPAPSLSPSLPHPLKNFGPSVIPSLFYINQPFLLLGQSSHATMCYYQSSLKTKPNKMPSDPTIPSSYCTNFLSSCRVKQSTDVFYIHHFYTSLSITFSTHFILNSQPRCLHAKVTSNNHFSDITLPDRSEALTALDTVSFLNYSPLSLPDIIFS